MSTDEDSVGYEIAEEQARAPESLITPEMVFRYNIAAEFAIVARACINGIYIIPSHASPLVWFGVMFVRSGVFQGAILRFTLTLPENFPETEILPEVRFECEVFHPHIFLKERTVDMKRFFPDGWKSGHRVVHVVRVIQRIFFSLDADIETCANSEAAILWKDDKSKFRELARQCMDYSRSIVYEDPPHADDLNCIRFSPWCEDEHKEARAQLLMGGKQPTKYHGGYSWVDPEAMTFMTEPTGVKIQLDMDSARAHSDRVAYGIERLDLSGIVDDAQEANEAAAPEVGPEQPPPLEEVPATMTTSSTSQQNSASMTSSSHQALSLASPVESMREGETTDDEELGESRI